MQDLASWDASWDVSWDHSFSPDRWMKANAVWCQCATSAVQPASSNGSWAAAARVGRFWAPFFFWAVKNGQKLQSHLGTKAHMVKQLNKWWISQMVPAKSLLWGVKWSALPASIPTATKLFMFISRIGWKRESTRIPLRVFWSSDTSFLFLNGTIQHGFRAFQYKIHEIVKGGLFFLFLFFFVFRPGFVAFMALPCFAYLSIYI